ncbi:MAG: hypothetical protein J0L53_09860 [Spirochaetes bacterium]|nr:hypothetical protein [Spirochaetota bacterium]
MRAFLRLFLIFTTAAAYAVPYQWESKSGESPFTLDVPETWRVWESTKRNGVIVQFRKGHARIEVRSFAGKEKLTISQIVNQKAARLSSEYSLVRLIDERDSKFRENLHLSVWEIRSRGRLYREETAIVVADTGPVVVSCLIPRELEDTYRTHCENAFYSLVLEADKGDGSAPGKRLKVNLVDELAKLYFLNIPGNLPVIPPEAVLKSIAPVSDQPATNPVQYDDNFILPNELTK